MQGKQIYQPKLFTHVRIEDLIQPEHLLRKIDRVLDLGFIRGMTRKLYCEENGRPSIDPEVYFRLQILAYIYGIESDRQLCDEVRVNIAYRWFAKLTLEDEAPDHSSMTRIRDRLGEDVFRRVFERIVLQCKRAGLVPGKRVIVDATLVEADASLDSMVGRKDGDPEARELKNYEKRYHDFREGDKKRKMSNQTHVSTTDPDATMVSRKGSYMKLSYKAHYSVDAKNRIVMDCHVTTGARHECKVMPDRIHYLLGRFKFPIEQVMGDKGYGRGDTYSYLRGQGIRSYIPLHSDNLGKGRISRGEFQYNRHRDCYICPAGQCLYPYEKMEKGILKRYRVIGRHCRKCEFRQSCLPEGKGYRNRARFIYRSPHQDEIDWIRKRQGTAYFKSRLRERAWKIEGLFGEAKENHGLRRAKYRGIEKTQIQVFMIATVQNLKRLALFSVRVGQDIFLIFWLY